MEKHKQIKINFLNVNKSFNNQDGGLEVIKNFSCSIGSNSFYTFLGPSGCGKTTLLNLIAGVTKVSGGSIVFENIGGSKKNKIINSPKIGYVFQDDRLLPWKSVKENLDVVMQTSMKSSIERSKIIKQYLNLVGLATKENCFPGVLSGGERQRISFIRSLCINPDVILMDEPFSHLDEMTATLLRSEVVRMWEKSKIMTILVTHNIFEAIYLSDKIFVIGKTPLETFKEVNVNIPHPRNNISFDEFVFLPEVKKIVMKIRKIMPNGKNT